MKAKIIAKQHRDVESSTASYIKLGPNKSAPLLRFAVEKTGKTLYSMRPFFWQSPLIYVKTFKDLWNNEG